MKMIESPAMKISVIVLLAFFCISCTQQAPKQAAADDGTVTQATLLDRIQIEDMLTRYYVDLTSGSGHDLAQYYSDDALLDVNGMIAEGREAIEKLYEGVGGGDEANLGQKMHMLLSDPIISVKGNTATAWVIWTGVMNDDLKQPPHFQEQGREYDELVKLDGRWRIKKRYITADSGMPDIWDATYKPRKFR
jgi:ketosteroid isomerase-like protein